MSEYEYSCSILEPCTAGNVVPTTPMCMVLEALASVIIESQGFEFKEEGPLKKKGIVGLNPGRRIVGLSEV